MNGYTNPILRIPLWLPTIVVLFSMSSVAQENSGRGGSLSADGMHSQKWRQFKGCPIKAEHIVDVPALESGVLKAIEFDLNDSVQSEQSVAILDTDIADMSLQLAELELRAAKALAEDNSNVEFHEFALKQRKEDLKNHELISSSVSGTEMRQKRLEVEQARVALNRAQHGMQRAIVDSQLEAASLEAAKLTRSRRSIAAPISGIVSRTFKHVGQWVEAGEPVLQLTDLSNLMVDQSIPIAGNRLVDLVGKEVRVRAISQLGHEIVLAGYIASYDHVVSARGEVRVHVRIPNRMQQGHWLLLPGMNCTLFLPTTTATNSNEAGLQPNSVTKNQVHGSGLAWNRK